MNTICTCMFEEMLSMSLIIVCRHLLVAPHAENLWEDQIFPGIAVTIDACQKDIGFCDGLRHQVALLIVAVHQATEILQDEIFVS